MTVTTKTMCALLAPLGADFEPIRRTIERVLEEMDVQPINTWTISLPGPGLYETVLQAIVKADLVIADVTGANPNVMYEVGFAHGLKKPVLIIVRSGMDPVPADLRGELFFVYKSDQVEGDKNLEFAVRTWVERHTLAMQSR